jgi:hypothetical protein
MILEVFDGQKQGGKSRKNCHISIFGLKCVAKKNQDELRFVFHIWFIAIFG